MDCVALALIVLGVGLIAGFLLFRTAKRSGW